MPLQYSVAPRFQPRDTTVPGSSEPAGTAWVLSYLLGGVQIGRDTSNSFALSVGGLAVRRDDGSYVSLDADNDVLIDVSPLILAGIDPQVVRIPVFHRFVRRGDLIVVSDSPASFIYVVRGIEGDTIEGLDPLSGQIVSVIPPLKLLLNVVVLAVSLFSNV
jgi:hypothetical protein